MNWEGVTSLKTYGGLGIYTAKDNSLAMLKKTQLWGTSCQILLVTKTQKAKSYVGKRREVIILTQIIALGFS